MTVYLAIYLYSTKSSRHIIFAVFADWPQTAKIKLAKCFVVYACIYEASLVREMFSMTKPQKLCGSKIWRYTVVRHTGCGWNTVTAHSDVLTCIQHQRHVTLTGNRRCFTSTTVSPSKLVNSSVVSSAWLPIPRTRCVGALSKESTNVCVDSYRCISICHLS